MKLRVFQSGKGDCLLLTSDDGKRVLVDGGEDHAYRAHVAAALGALRADGGRLDLVYVSHIDDDHISGVLQLVDDHVAWRVHDHQLETNTSHREPPRPRPPEIAGVWHNAFHEQIPDDPPAVEELLAATAALLEAGAKPLDAELAAAQRDLATSVPQGIKLSRRIGSKQLGIPLNEAFGGKLAMVREPHEEIALGSLRISVIGPFARDLERLRKEWREWLRKTKPRLVELQEQMRADEDRLGTSDLDRVLRAIDMRASALGDPRNVTAPNLASLMLLVEEGSKTVLLTGDGIAPDIRAGLAHAGKLDSRGGIHVDVLKVQHHGAEGNIDPEFCRLVTADHYVICGNGSHENPNLEALRAIIDARIGPASARSANPGAERTFKLWFNSSSEAPKGDGARKHMKAVEQLITRRAASSGGRMKFRFLSGHSFTLNV